MGLRESDCAKASPPGDGWQRGRASSLAKAEAMDGGEYFSQSCFSDAIKYNLHRN